MSDLELEQLLREGMAAAKAGDKATAQTKLREATEIDQYNEKAWYWLASVVDTDEERRVCLGNVVVINPGNARAKELLDQLLAKKGGTAPRPPRERDAAITAAQKSAAEKASAKEPSTAEQANTRADQMLGVNLNKALPIESGPPPSAVGKLIEQFLALPSRMRAIILASAAGILALFLLLLVFGRGGGETPPSVAPTAVAEVSTFTAVAVVVAPTIVPTITAPSIVAPTFPPTWTPIPTEPGKVVGTPLAPPPSALLTGQMLVWVGRSLSLDKTLPLSLLDLKTNAIKKLNDDRGDFAVFAPDGNRVVYSRFRSSSTDDFLISVIALSSSRGRELSEYWGNRPALSKQQMSSISANGKIIVFSAINKAENDGSADIYWLPVDLNPLDATAPNELATETPTETNASSVTPTVAAVGTGEATLEAAPTEVVVSKADETATPTGTPEKVSITRVTEKDSGINLWPALSPDGQLVVFVSDRKALGGELDLYVKALNQPTEQALTTDGNEWIESAPQVSPNGKQIVFQAAKQKANQQLFIMNIDGSNRTPLTETTDPSNNIRPRWSPDGRYVAFTSDRTGKNEIFIIDVTTRETWQVTASEDPVLLQDWR